MNSIKNCTHICVIIFSIHIYIRVLYEYINELKHDSTLK